VDKFERNLEAYKKSSYKEEQIKQEFINPFFKALGWDVDNEQGAAPQYRDVIFEDSIKVSGGTKAPDYCFTMAGRRMFFVEAKKPSVNIEKDIMPSYQLRRYAWSAKLPLSILTDFEEFAVYESRTRPKKTDRASNGRITYFTYKDYVEKWDEIYDIFSKEAVLKGSFDKYAESTRKKRGTSSVDDEFLGEIEQWRENLAKNIALRNKEITIEELNFAVQQIIDRIVFLRMCEDRGVEKYEQLRNLLDQEGIYTNFCKLCKKADAKYNSGLFHFKEEKGRNSHPDEITLNLKVDDGVLKTIIKSLYYPNSPYEFSVLPAEILGNVYEQFLGKVIRLTKGHQAKVEEKPEVKKSGGVYYTPQFIVDYIVENTVGKLCEGKTPNKVSEIRILDPACGSGSFLLGAYSYLLKWHLNYYSSQDEKRLSDKLYKGKNDEYHLTIQEKKRILLNNIYGIDIDPQAVEVTKLSLLLKVLEGENKDALESQQKLFQERALPDLENNIKCGNSLIGLDIYDYSNLKFNSEDISRINPFDWESEFSKVMVGDGFDAIIGNPPYIRIQRIGHIESDYIYEKYDTATSKMDLSLIFMELSLKNVKNTGIIGFISTSQWLSTDYGKKMRELLSEGKLHQFIDFGSLPVFNKASTYPGIFILSPKVKKFLKFKIIESVNDLNIDGIKKADENQILFQDLSSESWNLGDIDIYTLLKRSKLQWEPLKKFGKAYYSIVTGMDKAFLVDKKIIDQKNLEKDLLLPYAFKGKEVFRYGVTIPSTYVIYPYTEDENGNLVLIKEAELKKLYPNIYNHLFSFKKELKQRKDSRKYYASGPDWYRHVRPGSFKHVKPTKLIIKGISKNFDVGWLNKNNAFSGANCPGIILNNLNKHSIMYILGILNSKLISNHLKTVCPSKMSGYTRFNANNINKTPIRVIDFSNPIDSKIHGKITDLSKTMLQIHKDLESVKTPTSKQSIQRQIDAIDKQIDRLVYELYGLTEEEIKIVEESF
jgi:type I restriction-modification system DNA methylase subunit